MKKYLLTLTGVMFSAVAMLAAPEEYVTQTASGSTSATVYFEPGPRAARLVVADVTSDKAASVLSWKIGSNSMTILKAVPATVTSNILTTVGVGFGLNSNIVSVTDAGVVTAHTAGTNSLVTNTVVTVTSPWGTNIAVSDRLRERTTTYYDIIATSSSNVISIATNTALTNGTLYLLMGLPDQWATNTINNYTTNGAQYDYVLTNAFAWTPRRLYVLTTNLYSADFAAAASAYQVYVTTGTGLAAGDALVLTPTNGGTFVREINAAASYIYQNQTISAATGQALAAGDRLFLLSGNMTTPVGAATVRLFADPIRVLPKNVPGVLSVDGTSAVTINSATVNYGK